MPGPKTTASYRSTFGDLLFSTTGEEIHPANIFAGTIDASNPEGTNVLRKGLVLTKFTSGANIGKYSNHDSTDLEGLADASNAVVLRERIDMGDGSKDVTASAYYRGTMVAEALIIDDEENFDWSATQRLCRISDVSREVAPEYILKGRIVFERAIDDAASILYYGVTFDGSPYDVLNVEHWTYPVATGTYALGVDYSIATHAAFAEFNVSLDSHIVFFCQSGDVEVTETGGVGDTYSATLHNALFREASINQDTYVVTYVEGGRSFLLDGYDISLTIEAP